MLGVGGGGVGLRETGSLAVRKHRDPKNTSSTSCRAEKQKTTLEQRVGVYKVTDLLVLLLVVTSAHGAKATKLLVTWYKSRQWHPTILVISAFFTTMQSP